MKNLLRVKKNYRNCIRVKGVKVLKGNQFKVLAKIGSGSFGDVLALKTPENEEVAAKIVFQDTTSLLEFIEWHKLDHPNILRLLKIIRQPEYNVFMMPLYQKTVYGILEDLKFCSSEASYDLSKKWISDVLQGLHYLHSMDICHLDVQAGNIMIASDMSVVIGDFSHMSKNTESVRRYGLKAFSRPPEAGNSDGHCLEVDGKSFDIWSFGMLCLRIWSSIKFPETVPDKRDSWEKDVYPLLFKSFQFHTFCKSFNENFPNVVLNVSELRQALNLIQGCLRYHQKDRPSTSLIQQHPLISEKTQVLLMPDMIWTEYLTYSHSSEEIALAPSKAEGDTGNNDLQEYIMDCTSSFAGHGDASWILAVTDTNKSSKPLYEDNVEQNANNAAKKKSGRGKAFRGWFRRTCKIIRSGFCCIPSKKK